MATAPALTLSIDDPSARDPQQVGEAIAWLAQARASGLPVRHAHCISRQAWQHWLGQADTAERARRLREDAPPGPLAEAVFRWGRGHRAQTLRRPGRDNEGEQREVAGPRSLETGLRELWHRLDSFDDASLLCHPAWGNSLGGWIRLASPEGSVDLVAHIQLRGRAATESAYLLLDGQLLKGSTRDMGLPSEQVSRLLGALQQARQLFEVAPELAWRVLDGHVWITGIWPQARGRYQIEHLGARVAGIELWSSFFLRENHIQPQTPLSFDLWQRHWLPVVFEALTGLPGRATRERRLLPVDRISGRLYFNINRLMATPAGVMLLRCARLLDRSAGRLLEQAQRGLELRAVPVAGLRKLWALGKSLAGGWRLLRRMLSGLRLDDALGFYRSVGRAQLADASEALEELDDRGLLTRIDATVLANRQVLERGLAHELLGALALHLGFWFWPRHGEGSFAALAARAEPGPSARIAQSCQALAARLQGKIGPGPDLEVLRRTLTETPETAGLWQQLLDEQGHRCAGEVDLSGSRWSEAPEPLLAAVAAALNAPAQSSPPSLSRIGPVLSTWSRLALLRDYPGWAFAAGMLHLRRLYLELGRRLYQRGLLKQLNDVWLIEHELLRDLLLELRRETAPVHARIRQAALALAHQREDPPPTLLRSDGLPPSGEPAFGWQGTPVSGGVAEGPVRVVLHPEQARPAAGDILVMASFTAGSAPLLSAAAGLITEVGDRACIAAITTRSLRLPAVLGLEGASQRLRDGQRVRIDGSSGKIEPVPS